MTRITILVDNFAAPGLAVEHGLSLWIETGGRRILFDTGQGDALEPNARALGVDAGDAGILVLSHGHYDHTGGVARVLRQAPNITVYCHPGVMRPRYAVREGGPKEIGIPARSRAALEALPAERFHQVLQPVSLFQGVGLTDPVPRETDYEDPGGPFYLDPLGAKEDVIEDDLALWIRTGSGVVVCAGCSHAGRRRLEQTVAALRALDPELVVPCHCTGEDAVWVLRRALGERVGPGAAGTAFTFEKPYS